MPTMVDPMTGLSFVLEVDGAQMAMFATCSGVGSTSEVIENKTTAPDGTIVIRKVPGRLKWSNLVLERGLDNSTRLWTWRQQVVDGKADAARKNGAVVAMGQEGKALLRWEFVAGWPCGWSVSSHDDAGGLAIERLEIAHEGLKLRVL
jgi:phage tail-like protein